MKKWKSINMVNFILICNYLESMYLKRMPAKLFAGIQVVLEPEKLSEPCYFHFHPSVFGPVCF
ncbi:MAG TPA: hypothetical protein VFV31_08435, partial [Chitinophagaceae bacterium]|nr:hypothetical protein [Chitinophagaceae bacterium]